MDKNPPAKYGTQVLSLVLEDPICPGATQPCVPQLLSLCSRASAPQQEKPRSEKLLVPTCRGSDGKMSACNVEDQGSIPGTGRSPGEGNGNPLQHSCLKNPMDGGA